MNIGKRDFRSWLRSFRQKYGFLFVAFVIPSLIMWMVYIAMEVWPFGNSSVLVLDLNGQYVYFFEDLRKKVLEGGSFLYTWTRSMGGEFMGIYAYYLATPLNWLCIFVPEAYLMEFLSYLVVFKIGLCGLTACIYLSRHFHTKRFALVLFSLFYAMSGYMAAYNWNVMWLDCIVLAPLIILGLEALAKEGKYKLYCLSLGIAILSNYYICIMICIYLVLYFLIILLPHTPNTDTKYLSLWGKNKLSACLRFALFSLLSGGIGALMLIPEALALQLSRFSSSTFPETLKEYFSLFDVLARHCMNVAIETGLDHWPNIYCSVAVILIFPLYVINKKIKATEKISNCILLLVMLLSFCYNMTSFVWHGLNYPDSLPARQSFLYILLLLTVCTEAFLNIKEVSKKDLTVTFSIAFAFVLLCQKLVADDAFTPETYLLTGLFLVIYAALLHLFHTYEKTPLYLTCLIVLIVVIEAGSNTLLTSLSTVSRTNYLANYDTYSELSQAQMAKDAGQFYRYEKTNLQVCFRTDAAIKCLEYIGSEDVC